MWSPYPYDFCFEATTAGASRRKQQAAEAARTTEPRDGAPGLIHSPGASDGAVGSVVSLAEKPETESTCDRCACGVRLVHMDLDMRYAGNRERGIGKQPRHGSTDAMPDVGSVHPIAHLQSRRPNPMKATTAGDAVVDEDAEHDIAAAAPFALPLDKDRPAPLQRHGLVSHPIHPPTEVVATFRYGSRECLRIVDHPAAQENPVALDPIR